MATIELTIEEKQRKLHAIQVIDNELNKIATLKGELPEVVKDLEDTVIGIDTRGSKIKDSISELESEVAKHEGNIKESKILIEKYNKQLDNVKNNREFSALTKEIEMQNLEIQLSEKKIRETQINLDIKKDALSINKDKLKESKKSLKQKQVELEEIIEKTAKKEKSLERKAKSARKGIEERILIAYDNIRHSYKNGLAVVTYKRNSCGGCFNKIPPQIQLELQMRKKLLACEHCGRILVDNEIAGIVEEVTS